MNQRTEPPDPDDLGLRSQVLGGLPIVNAVTDRLGLPALLAGALADGDARVKVSAAVAIRLVTANLVLGREPLYGLGEWAARYDPTLLGLSTEEVSVLNDDRVGRALEALFDADRASLLTTVVLRAVSEFTIDTDQLHNDSTSISVHGLYRDAVGTARGGQPTPVITFGHSKDHRPDLKQLVWILTVSADGAVPLAYRLTDGNTVDDPTHVPTWEGLVGLLGPHRLPLRRGLQAVLTSGDGPYRPPRWPVRHRDAPLPRRGRRVPRAPADPRPALDRSRPPPRGAAR